MKATCPTYVLQSQREILWNPFFSFTLKNCKGACFFNFARYFIPYFSGNIFNELDPNKLALF